MKKMLLHSCCAPCSSAVIERLLAETDFDISVFYYNPNIYPEAEYLKRESEQIRLINLLDNPRVHFIKAPYDAESFYQCAKGFEGEKEGGARCAECFALRLGVTAEFAKGNGFDIFATTLTVSPHKNATVINNIGQKISSQTGVEYYVADFKKRDGYKRSIELSKLYGLYRQNYCGCAFGLSQQKND